MKHKNITILFTKILLDTAKEKEAEKWMWRKEV